MVGVLALIFVAALASGVADDVDPERVRAAIVAAGPWGVALFVAMFVVGELIHIPGMVFVLAGVLTYGRSMGFLVALLGAVASVAFSFWLVRTFGGQALTHIRFKLLQRMLGKLDARPVQTVFVLRSIFWIAPALNYALAMSRVRFRDYLVGSTLGLVLPILGVTLLFEQAHRLGRRLKNLSCATCTLNTTRTWSCPSRTSSSCPSTTTGPRAWTWT
ncbi:MAG: TVP38/TMEM64 family protein [Deltaproteobacteria bacterium]|nr:TVP38/TMEM64 family protein [Deltaproteobacteria bacterium]